MHEHHVGINTQKSVNRRFGCNGVTACNGVNNCGVTAKMPITKDFFEKCNTVTPFPLSKRVEEKNKNGKQYYFFTTIDLNRGRGVTVLHFRPPSQKTACQKAFLL